MKVLVKNQSEIKLKRLNESAEASNSVYKFSGVFTPCSYEGHVLKNRNNRIYKEDVVLQHIGYLREKIKTDGCILGELDHPEGRFEVYLKEASHKITDLWWDKEKHAVMGTLELLPTPNGNIAKELVESGYPLYVSSRAAGDVDKSTDEVTIYQIFTYDLVCTPGFIEAKLDRVNESLKGLSNNAIQYLNESMNSSKDGIYKVDSFKMNENFEKYMKEHKQIDVAELATPLLESDKEEKKHKAKFTIKKKGSEKKAVKTVGKPGEAPLPDQISDNSDKVGLKFADMTPAGNPAKECGDSPQNYDYADHLNDDKGGDAEEKKKLIINISAKEASGKSEKSDKDDEKKKDIVSIEANPVKSEKSDGDAERDEKESSKESKEKPEDEETDEAKKTYKSKSASIEKKVDSKLNKYEDLLNSVEHKEKVKESIYAEWPFSISLSEANFTKFCELSAEDRTKCAKFIYEAQIYDIAQINDLFTTPLKEEKMLQKNWLRLADKEYVDLYTKAPKNIQDAIEESAKFLILETKSDVDEFWRRTGLLEYENQRLNAQEFAEQYKSILNPSDEDDVDGYSKDFINIVENWMTT